MMLLNSHIAALTFRQILSRRRWMIITLIAVAPVVMTLLLRVYGVSDDDPMDMLMTVYKTLTMVVVVPFIALLISSSAFGADVEDGTVLYLLAKPISRSSIVLSKLLVTSVIGGGLCLISTIACGLIALHGFDDTRLLLGFSVAVVVGSVLYSALFLALGLVTRRGLLIGLTYLTVWEGALAGLFTGTRVLSIHQYMLSIADVITTVEPDVFSAPLVPSTMYWMAGIVGVGAVAFCIYRLRSFQIGDTG